MPACSSMAAITPKNIRDICRIPRLRVEKSLFADPRPRSDQWQRGTPRAARRQSRPQAANPGVRKLGCPLPYPVEQIEHQIGRAHLGHSAKGCFGADEAAVLRQLVGRLTAAANAEIFAALAAQLDPRRDVVAHF